MTADRATLTITLPLVWKGDELALGPFVTVGYVKQWPSGKWRWAAMAHGMSLDGGDATTRAAAERAVEEAVMEKMGGVG